MTHQEAVLLEKRTISLIIGSGGLLTTIKKALTRAGNMRWQVPAADNIQAQADYLIRHPVPSGSKGIIFTDRAGNWLPIANAGYMVYWCNTGQIPVGAMGMSEQMLRMSVADFARTYWGIQLADKRLVVDILQNKVKETAVLLPITSNTGGVGKTTSSRQLADRASQVGLRVLLIDGNIRQSSQRSFFDPRQDKPLHTIADWRPGMQVQVGANRGRDLGVPYDICFAPPAGVGVDWQIYRQYIQAARRLWDFVVLDLDRISADDLDDRENIANGLLLPYIQSGDPCLVIVKAGRQTQIDALNLLTALAEHHLPKELIGIKDTVPVGLQGYRRLDYTRYGTFLGTEYQTVEASNHIANGDVRWDDPGLAFARENILNWALPDRGFNPERFNPNAKNSEGKKGRGRK